MNVALANYPISSFSSFSAWQSHFSAWVQEAVNQGAQVLVFPEYGAMELVSWAPWAVQQNVVDQIHWMQPYFPDFQRHIQHLAQQHQVLIIAPSFPVLESNRAINRVLVCGPAGQVSYQDKAHMTRFENEVWGVTSGDPTLRVFETPWGKIGIQICYDIEFPIGSALLARAGAQAILAPSCTETLRGASRVHVGARARALENQIWVGVSQTTGEAAWSEAVDINYGYTAIYTTPDKDLPETGILQVGPPQEKGWLIDTLDFQATERVQRDGQVFNARDSQLFWEDALAARPVEYVRMLMP